MYRGKERSQPYQLIFCGLEDRTRWYVDDRHARIVLARWARLFGRRYIESLRPGFMARAIAEEGLCEVRRCPAPCPSGVIRLGVMKEVCKFVPAAAHEYCAR